MKDLIINAKLQNIHPYKVDENSYSVKLNGNEGFDIIGKYLLNEVQKEIESINFNRYPSSTCIELRRLYSKYSEVSLEEVMVGNGSEELIQIIINSLLSKGEKILTLSPDFGIYDFYSHIMELQVLKYELSKEDFSFNVDSFIEFAQKNKIKLFIFSNPNNPTSKVIKEEDMIKIIENLKKTVIVVDEAYYEFYGNTMVKHINKYENLVVLRTLSKAFGLASIRIGFLISNEELMKNIKKAKPTFNINTLSQKIGEIALKNIHLMKDNVNKIISLKKKLEKDLMELEKIYGKDFFKVYTSYGNFLYVRTIFSKEIFLEFKENSISVSHFYREFLRITVGSKEDNNIFIETLKPILDILYYEYMNKK